MNKQTQRIIEITALLKEKKFLNYQELSNHFDVSTMTIRRDLSLMEKQHKVKLIPGGALYIEATVKDDSYTLTKEQKYNKQSKIDIGHKAVSLIEENDSIVIDSGTTTEYLANFLPENKNLTILCYTLNIFQSIVGKKNITKILAGGQYYDNNMLFESTEGLSQIKNFRSTKAFIGATGFSTKLGITCSNRGEPEIKKSVMDSTIQKVLLLDSSKFGLVRPCYFAQTSDFDIIITDSGIPQEYIESINKTRTKLIIV